MQKRNIARAAVFNIFSTFVLITALITTAQSKETAMLSEADIDNLVRRSYQYVAMYNVNQKLALAEAILEADHTTPLKNLSTEDLEMLLS